MKKNVLFLLFAGMMVFFSCKKDEGQPEEKESIIEQDKENLEKNGINMVSQMEELSSTEAVAASANFYDLVELDDPMGSNLKSSNSSSSFFNIVRSLAVFTSGESSAVDVFKSLKSTASTKTEGEQDFDDIKATYTWNSTEQKWDSTGNANALVFEFPATESSSTNNAVFSFTTYEAKYIMPLEEEDTVEVPIDIYWDLKIDNNIVMSYDFDLTLNDDDIPNSISSELTVSTFVYLVSYTGSTSLVDLTYTLKNGEKLLLELYGAATGDWSKNNIEDNTYTIVDSNEWNYDEYDSLDVGKVLYTSNASFTLMDIKIEGSINFKDLWNDMHEIGPYEGKKTEEEYAELVNEYINLKLKYVSNDKLIANTEAYVEEETYMDWSGEEVTDYYVNLRFVFKDNSKADIESYFEKGFADLEAEINDFIDDLNEDYDSEIEYVYFED